MFVKPYNKGKKMRKIKILCGFLFMFCIFLGKSNAQGFGFYGLGVKAGLSYSTQTVTSLDTSTADLVDFYAKTIEYKPGFTGGVFFDFVRLKNVYLGTGLEFFQKGYKLRIDKTDETGAPTGTGYFNYTENYFMLNFYAKLNPQLGNVNPYVIISPRIDFYLGYNTSFTNLPEVENVPDFKKNQILEDYKKITASISGGMGVELSNIIRFPIIVEFMYHPDLVGQYTHNGVRFKNTSFGIYAGVQF